METREERKVFLEGLNLTEESINSILDADDDPTTVHEWSSLEEMLNRNEDN